MRFREKRIRMKRILRTTHSAEETEALGERLGAALRGGEILALIGELGAGKTTLIRGIARGLGVGETVTSPTFVLAKPYCGRLTLYHLDFYRLESRGDFYSIGFEEFLEETAVVAIEWAEKFLEMLPRPFLAIELEISQKDSRKITFEEMPRESGEAGTLDHIFASLSRAA
jgi:tRNA threonylcarbamoyladenosine biosynthesis protein TsaE